MLFSRFILGVLCTGAFWAIDLSEIAADEIREEKGEIVFHFGPDVGQKTNRSSFSSKSEGEDREKERDQEDEEDEEDEEDDD